MILKTKINNLKLWKPFYVNGVAFQHKENLRIIYPPVTPLPLIFFD